MRVKRIAVEEGFLRNLDLELVPGLNVIIGPRGTGKTSVIELLRFGLGVPGVTTESSEDALDHALSVLESGQVTLTLEGDDGLERTMLRSRGDESPRSSEALAERPLIFSQREIEKVGLEPAGRLKIIDGFLPPSDQLGGTPADLLPDIKSLTVEIASISEEMSSIRDSMEALSAVPEALLLAKKEEEVVMAALGESEEEQKAREKLADQLASAVANENTLELAVEGVEEWARAILAAQRAAPDVSARFAQSLAEETIRWLEPSIRGVRDSLRSATEVLDDVRDRLNERKSERKKERIQLEEASRQIRKKLEEQQKGASSMARRVKDLREKESRLHALKERLQSHQLRLKEVQARRANLLVELEDWRERLFDARTQAARELSEALSPAIRITVRRSAQTANYESRIRSALRGSGMHYNSLAPLLAERLSPRELAEAAESHDTKTIAELADLTTDRAERVAIELAKAGVEEVITARVEDDVDMCLLDQSTYKSTDQLSMGQRCTVILSILLERKGRTLIVDQPEDHLDNAFIADTLIRAIRRNKASQQLIFTTHNPNIPVLGEADLVVLLGSDGEQGYIRSAEVLDHPDSVAAITTVMEGGKKAFRTRAEFYGRSRE